MVNTPQIIRNLTDSMQEYVTLLIADEERKEAAEQWASSGNNRPIIVYVRAKVFSTRCNPSFSPPAMPYRAVHCSNSA